MENKPIDLLENSRIRKEIWWMLDAEFESVTCRRFYNFVTHPNMKRFLMRIADRMEIPKQ